ncbi:MAG TPA: hypothetical protein VH416_05980 [Gaiellaceae bacterium]
MAQRAATAPPELRILRETWASARRAYRWLLRLRPAWVLGALVVGQCLAVAAFALTVRHNAWLYYQGGDQTYYYTSGWALAHGYIPQSSVGYGWPLALAPLAAIVGTNYLGAVPVIVVVQAAVLLPLGLLGVYGIGNRIAGRTLGYLAAAGWVVAPFLAIPGFVHRYHPQFVEQFLPQAFGFTGLADFVSMIVVIGAAYFFLRSLDGDSLPDAALAGLLTGFAIGVKPANVLFLAGPGLAVLVARRWRTALVYGVVMLPAVLALALWKDKGLGHLPVLSSTGSVKLAAGATAVAGALPVGALPTYTHLSWGNFHENLLEIQEFFWSLRLVEFLPIAGVVALARISGAKAALIGGWLGGYLLVKGGSSEAGIQNATFWRLLMPAWPAYLLLAVSLPLLVPGVPRRLRKQVPRVKPLRWRSAPVIAAAVLLAAFPLAAMAALPAQSNQAVVNDYDYNTLVPIGNFGLRATVHKGTVTLNWSRQAAAGIGEFYRVYRSSTSGQPPLGGLTNQTDGIACVLGKEGARSCQVVMTLLPPTRATTAIDRPPPFPGQYTYRVGLAANWIDDPTAGDVLLLSEPVRVDVRK